MKTLKDILFENCQFSQIGIDESMNEPRSLWAGKAEAKIIQDKLQNFLKGQKSKVSLTNKSELGKFFKAFVATLTFGNTVKNLQVLKEYGMASEQGFASVVLGNKYVFFPTYLIAALCNLFSNSVYLVAPSITIASLFWQEIVTTTTTTAIIIKAKILTILSLIKFILIPHLP